MRPDLTKAWDDLVIAARNARPAITTYNFVKFRRQLPSLLQARNKSQARLAFAQAAERFAQLCRLKGIVLPQMIRINDVCKFD